MAGEKLLTELQCKAAKPKENMYYLNDGGGLRLRVMPDGKRNWLYRFRLDKKEQTNSLGVYPTVSLQEARAKLSQAKLHVKAGVKPSLAARIEKANKIIQTQATFGLIASEWLVHNKGNWSDHHYERNEGLLRRYLLPDLEHLPIDSIPEHFLVSVLREFYDSGVKESARRARAVAAQIFSYAKATHRGTKNPARDMSDNPYFKKPSVNHFKALPKSDVTALMGQLNKKGGDQTLDAKTICALKMAIYTGLRDNSIRGARWGEINLKQGIWTVPSERMKSGRLHIVPLPEQAVLAFTELKPLTYRDDDSYVFPSAGKNRYMAENTLRLALHRLGFKVTVHGMRSLITDVLHEHGYASEVIERQLDHADTNQVRKAYLRSDFMDQRILMMQWFADWCDSAATVKGGAK